MLHFWLFGHEVCGILAPRSGIKPTPSTLEGKVLTTGPPGKPPDPFLMWEKSVNILKSSESLKKEKHGKAKAKSCLSNGTATTDAETESVPQIFYDVPSKWQVEKMHPNMASSIDNSILKETFAS